MFSNIFIIGTLSRWHDSTGWMAKALDASGNFKY